MEAEVIYEQTGHGRRQVTEWLFLNTPLRRWTRNATRG
jgi:hypothetical protein